jgi:hypothetical protein
MQSRKSRESVGETWLVEEVLCLFVKGPPVAYYFATEGEEVHPEAVKTYALTYAARWEHGSAARRVAVTSVQKF